MAQVVYVVEICLDFGEWGAKGIYQNVDAALQNAKYRSALCGGMEYLDIHRLTKANQTGVRARWADKYGYWVQVKEYPVI